LVIIGLWVIGLFGFSGQVLLAQGITNAPVLDEPSGPVMGKPLTVHKGQVAQTGLAAMPPLPFHMPQLGPAVSPNRFEDVDHRSTAFIPHNLDRLTPVVLPKNEAKWIRVDLSEQIVVAYEGRTPVRAFIVSSGLPRTPTVLGEFRIKTKVVAQTMSGENYNLPNVQWVQYFYQDYSFHGTYWHNKFGQPMSHGCLNMTNADAKWLFDWAGPKWDGKSKWYYSSKENPGTLVIITE
jgi:lipoprotein-anchoring transpeptidase ErfK/SrfK